jgi:hypothetical protein
MARERPRDAARWLLRSRELSNFTYELRNEDAIPPLLEGVLGGPAESYAAYLDELRGDRELIDDLRERLAASPRRDSEPRLGKRRLLYCVVRAERPELIAESGLHDGLGAAVLLRALERNEREGSPGRLLSFDLNADAGWLVDAERHAGRFEFVPGDVRATLEPALERAGGAALLIQDSLKTHEHETFELEAACRHPRGDRLVLYSDDASSTGALGEVCERHGGRSATLWEEPERHHWRGNELGLCLVERGGRPG